MSKFIPGDGEDILRTLIKFLEHGDERQRAEAEREIRLLLGNWARGLTRDSAIQEDLVSWTREKLWTYCDKLGEKKSVSGYAWRIMRNRLSDIKKGQQRDRHVALEGAPEPEASNNEDVLRAFDSNTLRTIVQGALAKLGEPHRTVLSLRAVHNMKFRQIAGELNIGIGTAYKLFREACELMKGLLPADIFEHFC